MALALGLSLGLVAWVLRWSERERRELRDELDAVDRHAGTLVRSSYSHPLARAFFEHRVFRSLVVWGVLFTIAWLDADRGAGAQHAAVWGVIVSVFEAIVSVFDTVGAAIADSLVGVVAWLVSTLGWLWGVVKDFLVGTGAIFARVWDGLKIVWSDVLKPAFQWLDQTLTRIHTWLKDTFQPVFDFLKRVRDAVRTVYDTFVKPVLATIDFIRQLDRTLQVFHINLLKGLDAALTKVEQRIDGVFLWIYGRLADIFNVLNTIVGADGFFARYTFLKTAERDAAYLVRLMWNAQIGTMFGAPPAVDPSKELSKVHAAEIADNLTAYADTGAGDYAAEIDKIIAIWNGALPGLSGTAIDLAP